MTKQAEQSKEKGRQSGGPGGLDDGDQHVLGLLR